MKSRIRILEIISLLLSAAACLSLFDLQVVNGAENAQLADTASVKSITVKGERGKITDRYGRILAANKAAYQVNLNVSDVETEDLNSSITGALGLMYYCGIQCEQTIPIALCEGGYCFSTSEIDAFLSENSLASGLSANDALETLRREYSIPGDYGAEQAAQVIAAYMTAKSGQNAYTGLSQSQRASLIDSTSAYGAPFTFDGEGNVKFMDEVASLSPQYVLLLCQAGEAAVGTSPGRNAFPVNAQAEPVWNTYSIRRLKSDTGAAASDSADETMRRLVEKYGAQNVPSEYLPDLLAVRVAAERQSYKSYTPLKLGVSEDAKICALVEENAKALPGIEMEQSSVRSYPYGELLSQTLGYTGRITAETESEYQDKGYDTSSDLVGRAGLELTMEDYLRARSGKITVLVNRLGLSTSVISQQAAENGSDVSLTIDANLQKVAEDALDETMENIRSGSYGEKFSQAYVGAAVALDITSGEVLALASRPGYDPNIFSGAVSAETWKLLNPVYTSKSDLNTVINDPSLPSPMFNAAVSGAYPPGSTFKLVTAIGALSEKVIDQYEQIYDEGLYTRFSVTDAPACWTWNDSHATHGWVDIRKALAVSCNYFFYEAGYRLGIDKLEEYAKKLGMGQKTGIELPNEAAGTVGGKTFTDAFLKKKTASLLLSLTGMQEDDGSLQTAASDMVDDFSIDGVRGALLPLGLSNSQIQEVYDYINENRWRESRILSAAVGQGDNSYSVLQMCNLAAQVATAGERYTPTLVLSVPEEGVSFSAKKVSDAFIADDVLQAVQQGMQEVTSAEFDGTAARFFKDCGIKVAGKTGTAQAEDKDAYAWFVCYAPADNPRIAVAVMIARGGHGSYAAPVARKIIEAYFKTGEGTPVDISESMN